MRIWLCIFMSFLPTLLYANGVVTLLEVEGRVRMAVPDNPMRPVTSGAKVREGVRLVTEPDSRVVVLLSNGAVLTLLEESELVVTRFRHKVQTLSVPADTYESGQSQTRLQLRSGALVAEVKRLAPQSRFNIDTPLGSLELHLATFYTHLRESPEGIWSWNVALDKGSADVALQNQVADMYARNLVSEGYQLIAKAETTDEGSRSFYSVENLPMGRESRDVLNMARMQWQDSSPLAAAIETLRKQGALQPSEAHN